MDQFTLLAYLQARDKKLGDTFVNARLSGSNHGMEEIRQERAVLAALADLVRASNLPKHKPGVVGKPGRIEETPDVAASVARLTEEGPEFDPDPDPSVRRAAADSLKAVGHLTQADPSLAPRPPAQFVAAQQAAKNKGGRPRKDGSPAQPRSA